MNTVSINSKSRTVTSPFVFAMLCSLLPAQSQVQAQVQAQAAATVAKPTPTSVQQATEPASKISTPPLSSHQIAQRPYSMGIPAPLFPASPRKQLQFMVQYVYNYSQADYTPAVSLPLVSRAAVDRSTPEAALIAYYSAMRSGDYEAWLQCWDDVSRTGLEAITKQQKNGPEYWRALWRQFYAGKRFVLIDRLETVNYIILDARVEDPTHPAAVQQDSEILIMKQSKWFLSNAFSTDGLVMNYDGKTDKVVKEYELAPLKDLVGAASLSGAAQKEFLSHHVTSASINRTVE